MRNLVIFFAFAACLIPAGLQALECPDPALAVDLPREVRAWYRNPDGSCVQCSIGMCGVDQNVPQASTLLWDSVYGKRVRGGSWPERVASYSRTRQIPIWNITGTSTFDWMRWACATGRGAAIGCGAAHFQTLMGWDGKGTAENSDDTWYVCNNNSTGRIDVYSDAQFRRLHYASGQWIVVLKAPPHPARPEIVPWWH